MDALPEIKPINLDENEEIDDDSHMSQDESLEIQLPEESSSAIFEIAPVKKETPLKSRGRPKGSKGVKKEVKIVKPPEEDVLPDIEDDIEEIEIPQPKTQKIRTFKDIVWLNDVFVAGGDNSWLSSKRIKMLLEKYAREDSKECDYLTYNKFCKWAKWRFGAVSTKKGKYAGVNRLTIAKQEDLMYCLGVEGEEFEVPTKKEQPKTFDFSDFKSYMDAYEKEKDAKRKEEEIARLKREKEELELERKYYAKFQRQQMMERQNAINAMPQQPQAVDWNKYRGL